MDILNRLNWKDFLRDISPEVANPRRLTVTLNLLKSSKTTNLTERYVFSDVSTCQLSIFGKVSCFFSFCSMIPFPFLHVLPPAPVCDFLPSFFVQC